VKRSIFKNKELAAWVLGEIMDQGGGGQLLRNTGGLDAEKNTNGWCTAKLRIKGKRGKNRNLGEWGTRGRHRNWRTYQKNIKSTLNWCGVWRPIRHEAAQSKKQIGKVGGKKNEDRGMKKKYDFVANLQLKKLIKRGPSQ